MQVVGLGMALSDRHAVGIPAHLELQGKGRLVTALQVLPAVDLVSGAIVLVQLLEPVQHSHVGQLGQRLAFLNLSLTLGVLFGALALNVLDRVLAIALALALGATLLLILVMVLGLALLGDILVANVIASAGPLLQFALDGFLGRHCPTKFRMPRMPRDMASACDTQRKGTLVSNQHTHLENKPHCTHWAVDMQNHWSHITTQCSHVVTQCNHVVTSMTWRHHMQTYLRQNPVRTQTDPRHNSY